MKLFKPKNDVKTSAVWTGATIILLVLVAVFGVIAYLTDSESVLNRITGGWNDTKIHEEFSPLESLSDGVNTYKKSISVKNTGNQDAFIRVRMEFSDDAVRAKSGISFDGTTFYSAMPGGAPAGAADSNVSGILPETFLNHLPEGWVFISDSSETSVTYADDDFNVSTTEGALLGGYFYYTGAVSPGQSTAKLTDSVRTYFASQDEVVPYDIIVYEESVQTKDKDGALFTGDSAWKNAWIEFLARK